MHHLVVITFEGATSAESVRETLAKLQREGRLRVLDAAVLVSDAEGNVKVDNEISRATKVGAGWGALFGVLLTFVFPIAGIVAGAGGGALVGSMLQSGVDRKFVDDVKETMKPGTSALFVAADNLDPTALRAALQNHPGTLLQTTLDESTAAQLRSALGEK